MDRSNLEKMIISNIRKYRLEKNMTQEELAQKSNLQTGYIGGIESAKRFPKIDNLYQIANGLGIDIAYLVSEDANRKVYQVAEKITNIEKYVHDLLLDQNIPDSSRNQ